MVTYADLIQFCLLIVALMGMLYNLLEPGKRQTPVIIDGKPTTSSPKILNDLKILFNFEMDSRDRAVVLLFRSAAVKNTLRLAAHEPLRQRIVMNYDLDGMSKEEGRRYIQEKLRGISTYANRF